MRITVTGRRTEVSDALKEYVDKKASKLGRFYDRVQSVEVIFDVDGSQHRCEVIAKADHHTTFVAKEAHDELYASLDAAVKDLERQLTRHKERHRNRKHLTGRDHDREPMGGPSSEDQPSDVEAEGEAS
jgi:putative sigma-54 modulation protein